MHNGSNKETIVGYCINGLQVMQGRERRSEGERKERKDEKNHRKEGWLHNEEEREWETKPLKV